MGTPVNPVSEELVHTLCALCESDHWDRQLYRASLPDAAATPERFSARRTPDRVHYRIVRCKKCGLVRSDPILSDDALNSLYRRSTFGHVAESESAAATYARYAGEVLGEWSARDGLLEIGCGNGAFLAKAVGLGFAEVTGVEPSQQSVNCAPAAVRERIVNEVFRGGLFTPASFSMVCGFQVLDHVPHPLELIRTCRDVLKPGGIAFFLNHDVSAWTNRLLGRRSPIIDIEHIYLFDPKTIRALFVAAGFEVRRVFRVVDRHPLAYWLRLAPLPRFLASPLIGGLHRLGLGDLPVSWKAGNLAIVARRPESGR